MKCIIIIFCVCVENQCLRNGWGGGSGRRLGVTPQSRRFKDSCILATYSEEVGKSFFFFGMENGIQSSKYYFQVIHCKQMPQKVVFFSWICIAKCEQIHFICVSSVFDSNFLRDVAPPPRNWRWLLACFRAQLTVKDVFYAAMSVYCERWPRHSASAAYLPAAIMRPY